MKTTFDERMKFVSTRGRLLVKYLENNLSPEEKEELDTWRRLSPKNELCFQDLIDPEIAHQDIKAILKGLAQLIKNIREELPITTISQMDNIPCRN